MTLLKLLISAAVTLSVTTAAFAADPLLEDEIEVETLPDKKLERRGERVSGPITAISAGALVFAGFDANADYKINSTELTSGLAKAFKAADKDGSTTLSLFELEDWREAALGSLDAAPGTLAFDKDFDQRVTREEFDHAMTFVFKTGDKNEDGVLELNDLVKVFEMPRRPVIEEDNTIERINRQDREQRRRGY